MIKPYKNFSVLDVTQGFHSGHKAIDCVPKSGAYGKPLCAPEMVKIERIITPTKVDESLDDLEIGYGVWMKGLETGRRYLYWHCLPIFPVWGGQVVQGGQIVAYMGNSGNVSVQGKYVPLENRVASHLGVHLHLIVQENGVPVDPLVLIRDEPNYSTWDLISSTTKTLTKLKLLL